MTPSNLSIDTRDGDRFMEGRGQRAYQHFENNFARRLEATQDLSLQRRHDTLLLQRDRGTGQVAGENASRARRSVEP